MKKRNHNPLIDLITESNLDHAKQNSQHLSRRERRAAEKARRRNIKRQEEERDAKRSN